MEVVGGVGRVAMENPWLEKDRGSENLGLISRINSPQHPCRWERLIILLPDSNPSIRAPVVPTPFPLASDKRPSQQATFSPPITEASCTCEAHDI